MKSLPTAVFLKLPNPCKLSIHEPAVCDLWLERKECTEICEDIWAVKPNHNEQETSGTPCVPTEIIYFQGHIFLSRSYFCFFIIKSEAVQENVYTIIGAKSNPNLELLSKDDPWGNLNLVLSCSEMTAFQILLDALKTIVLSCQMTWLSGARGPPQLSTGPDSSQLDILHSLK